MIESALSPRVVIKPSSPLTLLVVLRFWLKYSGQPFKSFDCGEAHGVLIAVPEMKHGPLVHAVTITRDLIAGDRNA